MYKTNPLFIFLFLISVFVACSADLNRAPFAIKGYDFAKKQQTLLEDPLKEISGIAYDDQNNSFLAINDEHGSVYVLDAKTFLIKAKMRFAEKGDYEEIQFLNNTIYVLRSDGQMYKMKYNGTEISDVAVFEYTGPKAEFESFYNKPNTNQIVLIPKKSKQGFKTNQTIGYAINANTGQYISGNDFKLNWSDIKETSLLHPSAVAMHPKTGKIYLLASIEKLLIVSDTSGKITEEYKLDADQFQQPEGIAFDTDGNLYISNEAEEKKPTVIVIPVQTKN